MTKLSDELKRLAKDATPTSAVFNVGVYADGSGPMQRVRYDATSGHCPDIIWIDGGDYSDQWIAFDYQIAEEMCAAIRAAAKAIASLRESGK